MRTFDSGKLETSKYLEVLVGFQVFDQSWTL